MAGPVPRSSPATNEDRSVAVVLNGGIHNYRELRERLTATGHRFATSGDTEVIAYLDEEEDATCVDSLAGIFALELWHDQVVDSVPSAGRMPAAA
jgi:asparagine synthase (glutamine-hydrolysing)